MKDEQMEFDEKLHGEMLKKHCKPEEYLRKNGAVIEFCPLEITVRLRSYIEDLDMKRITNLHFAITKNSYIAKKLIAIGNLTEQGIEDAEKRKEYAQWSFARAHYDYNSSEYRYLHFMAETRAEKDISILVKEMASHNIARELEKYMETRDKTILLKMIVSASVLYNSYGPMRWLHKELREDENIKIYIKKYKDEK